MSKIKPDGCITKDTDGYKQLWLDKKPKQTKSAGELLGEVNTRANDYRVGLIWSNHRFVAQDFNIGPGYIEPTPWQRQDGHSEIPFP